MRIYQKNLALFEKVCYINNRCGMIAVKREVAARIERVFRGANVKLENWRQVTVQIKDSSASIAETVWDGHGAG